ncbi:MAG TPA: DUF4124 domain-containing protein [Limnobacter sp.]|nr:DUF4124 domain-containing protein [Limnobacter sp.]
MIRSGFSIQSLVFAVAGIMAVRHAQALGTEMFVCTGADGVRTYQNSDGGSGCVPLNLNPITIVPAPSSAVRPAVNQGSAASPAARRGPAVPDNRTAADFNAKDDRMKILQEELRIEESKLKSLQDEYKNGQPDRLGSEKNYQKYLDRVSRLEQEIMVTKDSIEILKTELTRLSR